MTSTAHLLPSEAEAERRLKALASGAGLKAAILSAGFVLMVASVTLFTRLSEMNSSGASTLPIDFTVFWTAARMFLEGAVSEVLTATDLAGFEAGQDRWMPWLYPPGYLLLIAPLGWLSFPTAWVMFSLVSLGILAMALRPFAAGQFPLLAAFTLSAGFLPSLTLGQNSMLWLAALIGALALIRAERPLLAGGLVGLMTLKPQLGPLVAVALLGGGHWRVIFSAALTAIVVTLVSTLILGTEYWHLLGQMIARHSERIYATVDTVPHMASLFALLVWVGIAKPLALLLQWAALAVLVVAIAVTWRRAIAFDLKIGLLLAALPLSSPYLWQYEAAALPLAALFFLRAAVLRPIPAHIVLLALMWLAAWPADIAQDIFPSAGLAAHHLIPPLSLIALALGLRQAFMPVAPAPTPVA